ncbi:hypothetical protein NUACC21_62980 [Scytonema sp. NUACC21]
MSKKNVEAIYGLSPSQQGMLFETLFAPGSGIHIEQSVWNFCGELNYKAFEQAWYAVVERHTTLRTAFVWKDLNEPLQAVLQFVKLPIKQQNWQEFSFTQQKEKLEVYLREDRHHGFNLTQAPLMRLAIFTLSLNTYQFVWTFHHILMDGWCQPLIFKEVLTFYNAFNKGDDIRQEPSRPYRDYITWLKQQDLSKAETFWRKLLQDFKEPTPLSKIIDIDNSSNEEKYNIDLRAHLPTSVTAKLQALAQQYHLTLNTLIQGVWALLLSRYSGNLDIVFGVTVSGRPPTLAEVESMIGLFINTLPMRIKVSPDTKFWVWLETVQTQHLEAKTYEYCSTGQVHQWSEIPSSLPLYESILVFENYPVESHTLESSDLILNILENKTVGAQTKYPLTILVIPGSELELCFICDNLRFSSSEITKIQKHFLDFLETIAGSPHLYLREIIETIPMTQIPKVRLLQKQESQEKTIIPRDTFEWQLMKIWSEVLKIHSIGVRDNFFDLGGHSLAAVSLMAKIQQQFGKNLPLATLIQSPTIEQLATFLRQKNIPLSWSPLVAIRPGGSKRPFFCVPGGGGNVLYFHDLARHLSPDQPFYGLQALGLDGVSKPHTRVEEIAACNIKAIQSIQPQGPYLLGGHSFGGIVAFEMAQQLVRQGQEIALLAIFDACAPVIRQNSVNLERNDAEHLLRIANIIERMFGQSMEVSSKTFEVLTPEEQLNYLKERLMKANLLPPDASAIQVSGLLQVFKANAQARYEPHNILPIPITLFQAAETNPNDIFTEEDTKFLQEPGLGWDEFSAEPVKIHTIPGDHLSMMVMPHVRVLAQKLFSCIELV